jgi:hypothetical protein
MRQLALNRQTAEMGSRRRIGGGRNRWRLRGRRAPMNKTSKTTCAFLLLAAAACSMPPANALTCADAAQNARNLAAGILANSNSYWARRSNFISLDFGQLSHRLNADELAAAERSRALRAQAEMPSRLVGFRVALANARSCLSAAEFRAIHETVTNHVRKVRFDRLPQGETEAVIRSVKTRMPQ